MNQVKKPFWVTAQQVTKLTGMTWRELAKLRKDNIELWDVVKGGGYRYNLNEFPQSLFKKETV